MTWPPLPAGLYYLPCMAKPLGIEVYIPKHGDIGPNKTDFRFSQHDSFEDTLVAAMSFQEQRWLHLFGCKPPKRKQLQRRHGERDAGIHYYIDRKIRANGRVHEIHYWTASWRKGGRTHLRKFGIKRYGYEGAYQRARAKRQELTDGNTKNKTPGRSGHPDQPGN